MNLYCCKIYFAYLLSPSVLYYRIYQCLIVIVMAKGRKSTEKAQDGNKLRKSASGKRMAKVKSAASSSKCIYIGHLAHGFYEKEMRGFFGQFGKVYRLKLFRSQKTNNSKGYAFVEFEDAETAKIVAEALDGYYLNEKRLVAHVIPPEKLHDGMFKRRKPKDEDAEDEDASDDVGDNSEGEGKSESKSRSKNKSKEDPKQTSLNNSIVPKQAKAFLRSEKRKLTRLKELGIDFLY